MSEDRRMGEIVGIGKPVSRVVLGTDTADTERMDESFAVLSMPL